MHGTMPAISVKQEKPLGLRSRSGRSLWLGFQDNRGRKQRGYLVTLVSSCGDAPGVVAMPSPPSFSLASAKPTPKLTAAATVRGTTFMDHPFVGGAGVHVCLSHLCPGISRGSGE